MSFHVPLTSDRMWLPPEDDGQDVLEQDHDEHAQEDDPTDSVPAAKSFHDSNATTKSWITPHWYGVDLDGTLAWYGGWVSKTHIGYPVYRMWQRVRDWLDAGMQVRIVTARANDREAVQAITLWCLEVFGMALPVTACKDYGMIELWDDRAVQVKPNTGEPYGPHQG